MACDDKAGGCASGGGLISPSLRGWGADSMHPSNKARADSRNSRMRLQGRTGSLVAGQRTEQVSMQETARDWGQSRTVLRRRGW